MKFTKDWLSDHLSTSKSEKQIIEKLNGIGLEVEKVEPVKNELSDFIVAKIIKANKHPNADRLKLCDVDIGTKETIKVVCGAPNAQDGLLTIYAPPGSTIPKNGMKLEVSKIRGETSYGMLCSEAELKLSNESEGIIAIIPSDSLDNFNSASEQSIPYEVSPLIFETSNFIPFFGIVEPGGA